MFLSLRQLIWRLEKLFQRLLGGAFYVQSCFDPFRTTDRDVVNSWKGPFKSREMATKEHQYCRVVYRLLPKEKFVKIANFGTWVTLLAIVVIALLGVFNASRLLIITGFLDWHVIVTILVLIWVCVGFVLNLTEAWITLHFISMLVLPISLFVVYAGRGFAPRYFGLDGVNIVYLIAWIILLIGTFLHCRS